MKDMTEGSVTSHLLQMSAFIGVSMLIQTLYLLADLYWVGSLGKEAIAAVGLAGNLMMIVLALTQALGVGTTTLISQAAGRKDQPRAELAFNQAFILSLLVGIALCLCSFALRDQYCQWLSADAATAALARSYLLWFIPALMMQFPMTALGSALRATGIMKLLSSSRRSPFWSTWCSRRCSFSELDFQSWESRARPSPLLFLWCSRTC